MAIAHYKATLRKQIRATAFSQAAVVKAAVNPANSTGLYQISNALWRTVSPDGTNFIEEQTNPGVWEEVFRITDGVPSSANRVNYDIGHYGLLTRREVVNSTSALGHTIAASPAQTAVRVSGGYLELATIGGSTTVSLARERSTGDITELSNTSRHFNQILLNATINFSRFIVPDAAAQTAQEDFHRMLLDGTRLLADIVYEGDADNYDLAMNPIPPIQATRAWFVLTGDENSFSVEDNVIENVSGVLDTSGGRAITRLMTS